MMPSYRSRLQCLKPFGLNRFGQLAPSSIIFKFPLITCVALAVYVFYRIFKNRTKFQCIYQSLKLQIVKSKANTRSYNQPKYNSFPTTHLFMMPHVFRDREAKEIPKRLQWISRWAIPLCRESILDQFLQGSHNCFLSFSIFVDSSLYIACGLLPK